MRPDWYFAGLDGASLPQLDPLGLPLITDTGLTQPGQGQDTQDNIRALAATSLGNILRALDGKTMENDSPPGAGRGILLGEALPPVPAKLANKIRWGEFVEIQGMLPDMWLFADEGEQTSRGSRRHTTDIRVWAQCFVTYVRVIAES